MVKLDDPLTNGPDQAAKIAKILQNTLYIFIFPLRSWRLRVMYYIPRKARKMRPKFLLLSGGITEGSEDG